MRARPRWKIVECPQEKAGRMIEVAHADGYVLVSHAIFIFGVPPVVHGGPPKMVLIYSLIFEEKELYAKRVGPGGPGLDVGAVGGEAPPGGPSEARASVDAPPELGSGAGPKAVPSVPEAPPA